MSGDYEVGYGRPPKRTRWKKSQTGNRGRRKARRAATNAETMLLLVPVAITKKGCPKRVTTLEAILLQLSKKALLGDHRAMAVWLKYQKLARQNTKTAIEIAFVNGDLTEAPPPEDSKGPFTNYRCGYAVAG
jgi:Family of unknown function (DUF5681)